MARSKACVLYLEPKACRDVATSCALFILKLICSDRGKFPLGQLIFICIVHVPSIHAYVIPYWHRSGSVRVCLEA